MSVYPIRVRKQSGRADSVSGGKDYHLVLIALADGRALFINRFGKRNTWGTGFHVERFETWAAADRAYQAKHREKLAKAYDEVLIDTAKQCATEGEFRKELGETYWNKIGKANLEWISPAIDTKGVREEKTVEFVEENGRMKPVETPKRLIPEAPAPVETMEDRAKSTPVWGMF
jgi:predicted DNA-binding WGR domain protein